ncbi:MAG: hypothetical protein ACHQ5A_12255 [Opitutales bacterium]
MAADIIPIPPASQSRTHPGLLRPRYAVLSLLGLGLLVALRAEEPLQSVFTETEYRNAGLNKLSPDEQAALWQALQAHGLVTRNTPAGPTVPTAPSPGTATTPAATVTPPGAAAASPAAPAIPAAATPAAPAVEKKGLWARIKDFGAEQLPLKSNRDEGEVTEVEAQLTEPFYGLQGRTVFRLDNGQVWQQRIAETYYLGKSVPNPKVILKRTRFGYRLSIPAVGPNFDVAVKRIQ